MVDEDVRVEFIGQIIDIFEDYLTQKGIAKPDKGFITGKDYEDLSKDLEGLMTHWEVFKDPMEEDLSK